MKARMELNSENNPNPVLSVAKDNFVLYSNEASEPLLQEWDVAVGEKLPSNIGEIVQRVISRNSSEKIEVNAGNRVFLVAFHPIPEECVNIYGFDISDQKEVERKLRDSESKYRNIVETTVEGIWIFNAGSKTTYVNEKMAEMLGYSRKEMLDTYIWDYADEGDKAFFQDRLANRKQRIDEVYELKLISKDGSSLWFSVSAKGFFDDAHKFAGSVGMFTDITERKKAEGMLAFERSQLLSIFDGIDDVVYVTDPYTYEVLYANKAMKEKFHGELVGGICYREFQCRDSPCDFCTNQIILKEKGKPYYWEYYNPSVNRYFMIMDRIIRWPDGRDVRFEVAIDITERKQAEEALQKSEEELETAQNISQIGSWTWDLITDEVTWSEQSYRNYGLVPGDVKPNYELFLSFIVPEDRERVNNEVRKAIESGHKYNVTYNIIRTDGMPRILLSANEVVRDKSGKIIKLYGTNQDITERKLLEEQTRQRVEELETLMDVVPVAIFIGHDPKCHNITGNVMANELYEAKLGENVSANISHIRRIFHKGIELTADELPMQKAAYDDVGMRNVELEWILPSGERRAVLGSASPLHDTVGKVRGSVGAFIDITDRKQAESKLKETLDTMEDLVRERTSELEKAYSSLKVSEQRLADAQKIAHVGSYDWNITTNEEYWSEELYRIFRVDPQIELNHNTFLNRIHPEDLEYVSHAINEALNGKPYNIDYRIILPDGEERIILSQGGVIFDERKTPVRMRGLVQDITESKKAEERIRESEEKYRNIVETANEGIALISSQGVITFVNNKMADMLGYSAYEIVGRTIWDFVEEKDKSTVNASFEKRRFGNNESFEIKLKRKDDSFLWMFINSKPLFDKDGKFIGVLNLHTDITKRKEFEEALANIQIARQKEIHHRIKNNLQVISSLLDLQADKFTNKECINYSEVLEAFRESQNRVISMALIHEELHKGEKLEMLNFSSYIKELADGLLLTYTLGDKAITLYMDLDQNIFFDMDIAIPLGIIINELVSNSIKHAFSGRDSGEIRIKLQREEGKRTSYILTVSDNGVGIPENIDIKDLESLGLQLVTTLIDQLDGELEMKRDNGTEFTIRFTVKGKNSQASVPALQFVDND